MPKYDVDDRGNVVDFYEQEDDGTWERCARLDREAGPPGDCDSMTYWDGGSEITIWAKDNGYGDEIDNSVHARRE